MAIHVVFYSYKERVLEAVCIHVAQATVYIYSLSLVFMLTQALCHIQVRRVPDHLEIL